MDSLTNPDRVGLPLFVGSDPGYCSVVFYSLMLSVEASRISSPFGVFPYPHSASGYPILFYLVTHVGHLSLCIFFCLILFVFP